MQRQDHLDALRLEPRPRVRQRHKVVGLAVQARNEIMMGPNQRGTTRQIGSVAILYSKEPQS
jgi:hypothetical protein